MNVWSISKVATPSSRIGQVNLGSRSGQPVDARTTLVWNMVYTGKPAGGPPEKNQVRCVVLDITVGLQRHNITCDNVFIFYALGQGLRWKELSMVGTVRQNKPKLPPALLTTKNRAQFSPKFGLT